MLVWFFEIIYKGHFSTHMLNEKLVKGEITSRKANYELENWKQNFSITVYYKIIIINVLV